MTPKGAEEKVPSIAETIQTAAGKAEIDFDRREQDTLLVRLSGSWEIGSDPPAVDEVLKHFQSLEGVREVAFDSGGITGWDSSLLTFLMDIHAHCIGKSIAVETDGLPEGVARLIALATAVPERKGARRQEERKPFLVRVGAVAIDFWRGASDLLVFIGEAVVAFSKVLVGKASSAVAIWCCSIQECGADALPIVSLISLLVGLILAFVGAVQLVMFGAQIYVANLVGIAMVREMGAIMTGIIMAGRTGAAFAAQLGTMQVNEEIDALQTMGISPMEFLVLPAHAGAGADDAAAVHLCRPDGHPGRALQWGWRCWTSDRDPVLSARPRPRSI